MKRILGVIAFVCLSVSAWAGPIPLTGTIRTPQGNLLNGRIDLTLSYAVARDSSANNVIVARTVSFPVRNGTLPNNAQIVPNSVLIPFNTTYLAEYFLSTGQKIGQNNFYISGTQFNIGTATPTTITTSNISFAQPYTNGTFNIYAGPTIDSNVTCPLPDGTQPDLTGTTTNGIQECLDAAYNTLAGNPNFGMVWLHAGDYPNYINLHGPITIKAASKWRFKNSGFINYAGPTNVDAITIDTLVDVPEFDLGVFVAGTDSSHCAVRFKPTTTNDSAITVTDANISFQVFNNAGSGRGVCFDRTNGGFTYNTVTTRQSGGFPLGDIAFVGSSSSTFSFNTMFMGHFGDPNVINIDVPTWATNNRWAITTESNVAGSQSIIQTNATDDIYVMTSRGAAHAPFTFGASAIGNKLITDALDNGYICNATAINFIEYTSTGAYASCGSTGGAFSTAPIVAVETLAAASAASNAKVLAINASGGDGKNQIVATHTGTGTAQPIEVFNEGTLISTFTTNGGNGALYVNGDSDFSSCIFCTVGTMASASATSNAKVLAFNSSGGDGKSQIVATHTGSGTAQPIEVFNESTLIATFSTNGGNGAVYVNGLSDFSSCIFCTHGTMASTTGNSNAQVLAFNASGGDGNAQIVSTKTGSGTTKKIEVFTDSDEKAVFNTGTGADAVCLRFASGMRLLTSDGTNIKDGGACAF